MGKNWFAVILLFLFLGGFGINQVSCIPAPTTTTTKILATTCSSAILKQGYPCCPSNCVVVYVDENGTWGVYSNRWCGCKGGGNNNYSCQTNILRQGYKCCSYDNCRLILKDESGKWGVENGQWCGLHYNCK